MKHNCLTRALDQWNEDKSMRLWYNTFNVVALEEMYFIQEVIQVKYEPLESFGIYHFIVKFELSKKHLKLLGEYFNSVNPNIDIQ
jgi:hypothetical protein